MANYQSKRFEFNSQFIENATSGKPGSRFSEVTEPVLFSTIAGLLRLINRIKPLHDSTTPRIQPSRHDIAP